MSVFKSEHGRERVLARCDKIIEFSGVACRTGSVETCYGNTAYIEAGGNNEEVLILLHGSCSNSIMWLGEIEELALRYRVIALDIIGDAGRSAEVRPELSGCGYAEWLEDFLNAMGIEKISLGGNSFGAWVALKFATYCSDRVEKIVLIAASGIVSVSGMFLLRCMFYLILGKFGRERLIKYVFGKKDVPPEVLEYSMLLMDNFKPMVEKLPVFADEELDKLGMPVLYIYGADDVTLSVAEVEKRIGNKYGASLWVLEGEGHVLENVMNKALNFLESNERKV